MYTLELTIGSVTKTVNPMSLTLPEQVCSDTLTHVELSVPVTLEYDAELLNFLISADMVNAIVKEGKEVKFTGVITTNLSFKDIGQPLPVESISLTIKDNTYKLKTKLDTELVLLNETLSEIIGSITVGCVLVTMIPEAFDSITLPIFIIEKGQQYLNALNQLCFSYEYSFYFNADGALCFFNFDSIPASVDELNGYHICTNEVSRQTKQYTGVNIGYNKIITKLNELVYYEGFGFDSQNKPAPAIIQPGVYFPFESSPIVEATEGQVYQSFESGYAEAVRKYNGELEYRRSKKTTLIYTQNHTLVEDWDGELTINRTEYESKRASVRFINNSTLDVNLYQLAIRADAWYRTDECEVLAGDTGTPYEYDAQYVYDAVTAENLAKCLYKYFTLSQFTFKTKHDGKTAYTGTYKNIRLSTGAVCKSLCIAQSYDPTTDITYAAWLTVSSPSVIPVTASKNTSGTGTEQGAADNAQNTADTALDQINDIVEGTTENAFPDTVTGVLAVAEENGIKLTANPLGNGTKNNIKKVQWLIKRHFDADWTAAKLVESPSLDGYYYFNRTIDGYPEADQLDLWEVKAQVVNTSNKVSPAWSTIITVTTDLYGTWSVGQPVLSGVTLKRALTVQCTQPVSSRKRYGDIKYRIEIKRYDDATYFKPNLIDNPYEDEQNYKDETGYVVVGNTFTQTVPMEGQSTGEIEPTLYSFQVTPYNSTTGVVGTPAQINLTATASGAMDLYPSSIPAEKLSVSDLSAIAGVFGSIASDAIEKDASQFWNLARPNSNLGYGVPGEWCLGTIAKLTPYDPVTNPEGYKDIDSFIHWLPESIDGLDQGVYMKLKSLLITAIKAQIFGNFEVVSNLTGKQLFKADQEKNILTGLQNEQSYEDIEDVEEIDNIQKYDTIDIDELDGVIYGVTGSNKKLLAYDTSTDTETAINVPEGEEFTVCKKVNNDIICIDKDKIKGYTPAIGTWKDYVGYGTANSLEFSEDILSTKNDCFLYDNEIFLFSNEVSGRLDIFNLESIIVDTIYLNIYIINAKRFENTVYLLTNTAVYTYDLPSKSLTFLSNENGTMLAISQDIISVISRYETTLINRTTGTLITTIETTDGSGLQDCLILNNTLYILYRTMVSPFIIRIISFSDYSITEKQTNQRGGGAFFIQDEAANKLYCIGTGMQYKATVFDIASSIVTQFQISTSNEDRFTGILNNGKLILPCYGKTYYDVIDTNDYHYFSVNYTNSITSVYRATLDQVESKYYLFNRNTNKIDIIDFNSTLHFSPAIKNIFKVINQRGHVFHSNVCEIIDFENNYIAQIIFENVMEPLCVISNNTDLYLVDLNTGYIVKLTFEKVISYTPITSKYNFKRYFCVDTIVYFTGSGARVLKLDVITGTQTELDLSAHLDNSFDYTVFVLSGYIYVLSVSAQAFFVRIPSDNFTIGAVQRIALLKDIGGLRSKYYVDTTSIAYLAESKSGTMNKFSGILLNQLVERPVSKQIGSGFKSRSVDSEGNSELVTADGEKLTFDAEKNLVAPKALTAEACKGNAATATKLATAHKIGSVDFDGTEDITQQDMNVCIQSYLPFMQYGGDYLSVIAGPWGASNDTHAAYGWPYQVRLVVKTVELGTGKGQGIYVQELRRGSSTWVDRARL